MTIEALRLLLWGALVFGCTTVSIFFVRFWSLSRDRFFLFFAAAFAFLALNWVGLVVIPTEVETRHYAYLLRLVAFVLIIVGIIDKNRRR
jgi:predicted permease